MTKKNERSPLALNIINFRNAKNWSQADLAHKVGVHVNTIKSIEGDQNEGNLDTRTAIAEALGCKLADLYVEHSAGAPNRPHFSPDWAEGARILNALAAAQPHRRLSALYLLTGDEFYLDQLRALPHGAQLAQALGKIL